LWDQKRFHAQLPDSRADKKGSKEGIARKLTAYRTWFAVSAGRPGRELN
jgi:hypothetical protein